MTDRDAKRAGDYARDRRGLLGLTQEQLARVARVDAKTINTFEQGGPSWPWARNLAKIENALMLPPRTLTRVAAGEDPPLPAESPGGLPPDAPACTVEGAIMATDVADTEKAAAIREHRIGGHATCGPLEAEGEGRRRLAFLSARLQPALTG